MAKKKAQATDEHVIEELYEVIRARAGADPEESYTAKLYARGPEKVCQKLGEEAVEAVIEGVKGDKDALAAESADLIYHLLVLWALRGVAPDDVWEKLRQRKGTSGLSEKAARKDD